MTMLTSLMLILALIFLSTQKILVLTALHENKYQKRHRRFVILKEKGGKAYECYGMDMISKGSAGF